MGTLLLLLIGAAVLLTILTLIVRRLRTGRPLLYPFVTNMTTPTKIYLDIDGTLIHEDLTDNYGKPAAGLEDFIRALRPYDVYWLTTHCMDGDPTPARAIVKAVLPEELHPDIDRIKPTVWSVMKTTGIDWDSDFIWIDNDIFPEERKRFEEAGPNQQYLEVDLRQNPEQLIEITRDVLLTA